MSQENTFHSAQDFVRALRATSDPPIVGGPSKIEIAQDAWADLSFYVPSKAEVISEWILTKLLKDKSKDIPENPIFDARYWKLLKSLSTTEGNVKSLDAKELNIWLTPLLNRIPLAPVVIVFLASYNGLDERQRQELSSSMSACLSVFWRISAQKMTAETLQECYGALLCVLSSSSSSHDAGISELGYMISTSYRHSLTNSSNKKKLCQTFLNSHLQFWIQGLRVRSLSRGQSLFDTVLDAGLETLFNLDVLRQSCDPKTEHPVLDHLTKLLLTGRDNILNILPTLCANYITSIKKHRGALFSQGSQSHLETALEAFHEAGLRFFISLLSLVDYTHRDTSTWKTRLSLLQLVDQENLFDRHQVEAQMTFNQIIDLIIVTLNDAWKESHLECTDLAVQCLTTIARIDYDLMLPFNSRLLPLFLQIPIPSDHHFAFLEVLLSYHTKTRTLGLLVQNLFTSISSPSQYPRGPRERYQLVFSSPIMHSFFMARLSKALHRFLTESQCLQLVDSVLDTFNSSWDAFYVNVRQKNVVASDEKPRKKRKADADIGSEEAETSVIIYSLTCRLASIVLSSLPMPSLSAESLKSVRQTMEGFRTINIHNAISKSLKLVKKMDDQGLWPAEVASVATLKLRYALNISRNLSLSHSCDEKVAAKTTELLEGLKLLPELTLELYRALLYNMSIGNLAGHEKVFHHLLQYLETNFSPADVQWTGDSHHLTKGKTGKAEAAVAIVHMVIERWLPQVDRYASSEQIERFLNLIMSIKVNPTCIATPQMQPEKLLMQLLHSAQFWEFPNIRSIFLGVIDKAFFKDPSKRSPQQTTVVLKNASMYRYLLLFPLEYFSPQLLNDLVKRALSLDISLSGLEKSSTELDPTMVLIAVRIFLQRACAYIGMVDQDQVQESSEFLIHLIKSTPGNNELAIEFTNATLDLIALYLSKLLQSAKKNGTKPILEVLEIFGPDTFRSVSTDMLSSSFTLLSDILDRDFPASSLPGDLVLSLKEIQETISSSIAPHVSSMTTKPVTQEMIKTSAKLISGWHSLLSLHKWLGQDTEAVVSMPLVGEKIASQLMPALRARDVRTPELDAFCVNTFAILLQELEFQPLSGHATHLDVIIAAYVYFSGVFDVSEQKKLHTQLAKSCRKMSTEDYVYVTTFVADSLSSHRQLTLNHLRYLVHFASLALHDHPTHSLTHVQKFAARCLNSFNDDPIFVQGPVNLREEVLSLLSRHCSDQQAALRSQDAAGIWLLLAKYLAPSQVHDEVTISTIFHEVISILSSLIRLRRDLVTHSLPHLGMLLRQLLLCMRACRPNLGAKQTNIVMFTQPRWINSAQPLGADEAKMLGRLLEGLLTKTTVKFLASSSSNPETQKAESLAKPFSKHAAYVLEAYIESMNDPLCVLSLEVRKELQPGIFALCSMISDHSRDALMASALDAGGKAILKSLWKEYDKQKYVGKG